MKTIQEVEALVQDAFKIGMLQSGIEARDFALWVQEQDISHIIESGTSGGGTLFLLDRVAKPGLRISLDMPWGQRDPQGSEATFKAAVPYVLEVLGNIHEEEQWNKLHRLLNGQLVDLLFIDSDHSYEGCKQHVEMYRGFVRSGGFIGFHDLSNGWGCGLYVKEELFPKYTHWLFEEPKNLYGIGVVQV